MQISPPAIEILVKHYEGLKLNAYRCPAGVCTIGYGHTSAAGEPFVRDGMTITTQQAEEILQNDLRRLEASIEPLLQQPLTQRQFDVVVGFTYNVGVNALKTSSLLKKINTAKLDEVPAELMKWTKAKGRILPGLVQRRQAEVAWWNQDNGFRLYDQDARSTPDAIAQRTMAQSKQGNAALFTAGLAGFGTFNEVASNVQTATDTANQLSSVVNNPNILILASIICLAAAIWYWRRQNMERDGV